MVTSIIPAISSAIKLRKKLTVSEQEVTTAAAETASDQKWGNIISIDHTLYTSGDIKSLYFSNTEWLKTHIK